MVRPKPTACSQPRVSELVAQLLVWFAGNARDLPWRRTRDPYAVWVSEIMLQQTQVKTVIPYWNRWQQALPTIADVAGAEPAKIHKLWEGLGYYTRVRNLQKAAQLIVAQHGGVFPENFTEVLALPGIGRYTAGAICSIAFNQPTPILDGNVIRVLTRLFGIAENPKEKATNQRLWRLAKELVTEAQKQKLPLLKRRKNWPPGGGKNFCSWLNQSLMELGALVCTPRQPECLACPLQTQCAAFRTGRTQSLPNLPKRQASIARHFLALVVGQAGKYLVRQRPAGQVNAHLWEFPNVETTGKPADPRAQFQAGFGGAPLELAPLLQVKHAITRYQMTLEAFLVTAGKIPAPAGTVWRTPAQMQALAFTSAHRKVLRALIARIKGV